jgi:hypothetical protein
MSPGQGLTYGVWKMRGSSVANSVNLGTTCKSQQRKKAYIIEENIRA